MPAQLRDINTIEVSIVKRGANRKKFLLYKSAEVDGGKDIEFTDLVDRVERMEDAMSKVKKDDHGMGEEEAGASGGMGAMKAMLSDIQSMVSRMMSLVSGGEEKSARDYTKHIPKDTKDGAEVMKAMKSVFEDLTEDLDVIRKSTRGVVELAEELAEELKGSVSKSDMEKVQKAVEELAGKIPTAEQIEARVKDAVEAATASAGA